MSPSSAIAALFFLSGAASLLYQVVWMRMLIRVFGSTTPAVSVVVAAFMGGLALGGQLGGRRSLKPGTGLKLYARLELAAAAAAVLSTTLMLALPEFYARLAGGGLGSIGGQALRLALCAAVLLPPTALMGATLPVLTRCFGDKESTAGFGLGVLYGFNTLGAVAGVLSAGFLALAFLGERRTVAVAAALNLICGFGALALSRFDGRPRAKPAREAPRQSASSEFLAFFALSGFCALGLEVLWSRLLILLIGSSVYAFSSLLAMYLLGVGAGSLAAAWRLRKGVSREAAAAAFGLLQAAVGASVLAGMAAYRLSGLSTATVKYLLTPFSEPGDLVHLFRDCFLVVFPPSLFMGMSFPLAVPLLARSPADAGAATGRAYAANTLGGVLGSLSAGFVLVPLLGTAKSVALLAALSWAAGGLILLRSPARRAKARPAAGALAVACVLCWAWAGDPARAILEKQLKSAGGGIAFHHETTAATVTGVAYKNGAKQLLLNGIVVSGNGVPGKAMAYVPLLLRPAARRMLVICFGAGNTFHEAVASGRDVDAVDLVPGVIEAFPWFYEDAMETLSRPNARAFVEDGRHFLLTASGAYDVIVVDGSPPVFSAQTVNLYTREFLELARRRLRPGGVLALWVPTPCLLRDFGMIARNFSDAFAHVSFWSHPQVPGMLLLGSSDPLMLPEAALSDGIRRLGVDRVLPSFTARTLLQGMPIPEEQLRQIARRFPPLTDDRPRTEFPLGALLSGRRFIGNTGALVRQLLLVDTAPAP